MKTISQFIFASDFLNFVGITFSALVTLWVFALQRADDFARKCHVDLIYPLFDILEPVLFQQIDADVLKQALELIDNNKACADGKLLSLSYLCHTDPSQENFMDLCSYVNRLYDRSSRRLRLKLRPVRYRILRHQYRRKIYLAFFVLSQVIVGIVLLFAAFIFTVNIVAMATQETPPPNFLPCTILIIFAGIVITKFMLDRS